MNEQERSAMQQALEALELMVVDVKTTPTAYEAQRQAITALSAALAQEQPEPVQEPSYERGFIDGMQKQAESSVDKAVTQMALRAQERATPVKPAPAGLVGVVPITTVSSVTSVPTQPYRVLTDADLDAIRKIVREGEEK